MRHLLLGLAVALAPWSSVTLAQTNGGKRPLPRVLKRLRADAPDLKTPYELKGPNYTATHDEVVAYCELLQRFFNTAKLIELGPTDVGRPLHLLVLSNQRLFTPEQARRAGKPIVWINNAIHPGEPEGVDASLMLARDLLADEQINAVLNDVIVCIVPMYNIDGALRRGRSRVNQNGPAEYGFRGNARNLDLNRDFIKADSRNARTWIEAFAQWRPHILLDNHTTNGADYPAPMTLIHSQRSKLHPLMSDLLVGQIVPTLYERMQASGYPMMPYYNPLPTAADSAWVEFYDSPRYSTGYAALFNCMGLVAEAHMLKPFPTRVQATYWLMRHLLDKVAAQQEAVVSRRIAADAAVASQAQFATRWRLDPSQSEARVVELYRRDTLTSAVTGLPRIRYDSTQRLTRQIRYLQTYRAEGVVTRPVAYLVPQAWSEVIDRLRWSGVSLLRLSEDVPLRGTVSTVTAYDRPGRLYEGHTLRTGLQLRTDTVNLTARRGDVVVFVNQASNRYIVETLEPTGDDSFVLWGFFDSMLGQKEYFSDYAFEDSVAVWLQRRPDVRRAFEAWRAAQSPAPSAATQLDWLYRQSPWFEGTVGRLPIVRLIDPLSLPLMPDAPPTGREQRSSGQRREP